MRLALRVLVWELWRQTWLAVGIALASMFIWVLLIHSSFYGDDGFVWVTAFVVIGFLFLGTSRAGLTFVFPQRQFTLPISTVSLLNIQLAYRLLAMVCVGTVLYIIQCMLHDFPPSFLAILGILLLMTLWAQMFVCLLSLFEFWRALGVMLLFIGLVLGMSGLPDVLFEAMFRQHHSASPLFRVSLQAGSLLFSLAFWLIAAKGLRNTLPSKLANLLSMVLLIALALGKLCIYIRSSTGAFAALDHLYLSILTLSDYFRLLHWTKGSAVPVSVFILAAPAGYCGALWALSQSRNRNSFRWNRFMPNTGWEFHFPERRFGQWSPLRAQMWYEWRQTYQWLPYLTILTALGIFAITLLPWEFERGFAFFASLWAGVVIAWGLGYFGIRKSVSYTTSVLTKPVSIPMVCRAKLWAGLAGVIPVFVLLALAGLPLCFMHLPEDRQIMMNQLALWVALILLLMFGALYLGRLALAYLGGFYLIAASIFEMLERSGYASEAIGYVLMSSGLIIPLILGLWMVFWAWRRRAIPRHYALISLVTVPGAVIIAGIMMFAGVMHGHYGILWFSLLVLMCNAFTLVWVPLMVYRQRHG
ncbi:MAG TPA: hypothetical protein PLI09_17070 [Candidatus Hydrogenedentes bacterium]|nr:hypothetical protein [Candidatus Hydrogenedentota bacterium]